MPHQGINEIISYDQRLQFDHKRSTSRAFIDPVWMRRSPFAFSICPAYEGKGLLAP